MPIRLTDHAAARMQQRSIPVHAVELLEEYARERHDHHGAAVLAFDKRSREAARRKIGSDAFRQMQRWLNAYAVVGESGAVITVGWRQRRVKRD